MQHQGAPGTQALSKRRQVDPVENDPAVMNQSQGPPPVLERPSVKRGGHWPPGAHTLCREVFNLHMKTDQA